MKENELMIDCLVIDKLFTGKIVRVKSIYNNQINIRETFGGVMGIPLDKLEPIEISEDWFYKFGFTRGALDMHRIYFHKIINVRDYDEDVCISFYRGGSYMYCNGNEQNSSYKSGRYVHELQIAIFGLTGIILECDVF